MKSSKFKSQTSLIFLAAKQYSKINFIPIKELFPNSFLFQGIKYIRKKLISIKNEIPKEKRKKVIEYIFFWSKKNIISHSKRYNF